MSDIRERLLDAGEFPGSNQLGISDYCALCDEAADEIDKLRAAVEALAAIVQRDRVALYQAHRNPDTGEVDAAGQAGLDEYDAALALADQALGSE